MTIDGMGDAAVQAARAGLKRLNSGLLAVVEEIKRLWSLPDPKAKCEALLLVAFLLVCAFASVYLVLFLLPLFLLAVIIGTLFRAMRNHN